MNYYEKAKAIISELRKKVDGDIRWDLEIMHIGGSEAAYFDVYIGFKQYEIPSATFEFQDVDEIVEDVVKRWKKN